MKVWLYMGRHGFARDQWGGKGQRGNMWVSDKDKNIIMTTSF
jgi:biotin-(acetyl-CoA carboxylase) ligase